MKFSENWLRELVEIKADRATLSHALTMAGLEVEELTVLGEGLAGVVVAEIVATEKHPEADRLQVCKVDAGQGELLQIVCGAPNARVGIKVPLAMVGASLPGGMSIKAAKLRGVESFGMLCSAKELGIEGVPPYTLYTYAEYVIKNGVDEHTGATCWVTRRKWLPIDSAA